MFPNSLIDFLIRSEYKDAVLYNPNINKVYELYRDDNSQIIEELKSNGYDQVVDLQNNLRTKRMVRKLHTLSYSFRKPNIKKFLLVKLKLNFFGEQQNIVQRYAKSIPGLVLDEHGIDLIIPQNITSQLPADQKYIGFCPGAKHFTKRWALEYFAELGKRLNQTGFTIVLLGGSSEKDLCAKLNAEINNSIDCCTDDDLFLTAANLKQCLAVISNDSGLMHVASAVKTRVVAVFGSSVKEFGFTPYGVEKLILENNSLKCRPCSHIGKNHCPKKHFKCLKEITPEFVFNNVINFVRPNE